MLYSIIAISIGAAAGAVSRWLLGLALDFLFPPIPMGTLASNLIGGYLIGVAMSFFVFYPSLAPEWRLLVITGFLGALTTFSTFSAEVVTLLQQGRFVMAAAASALHLFGSLTMTFLGIISFSMLRQS